MSAQSHNFKNNIFISYSQLDRDWVDALHERLCERLPQLLGEQAEIWRDIRMRNNEDIDEVLVVKLSNTTFLVSVLSPGYLKSKWCLWELDEFCRSASKNGGVRINNKWRVFKVIKSPIEDFDRPPILEELLKECLSYEFYEREKLSGKPSEFRPDLGPDSLVKFYTKIEDLSQDISAFATKPRENSQQSGPESRVYLAETTPDLIEGRNMIKRELQTHGYRVLPDDDLPFQESAFEEKVASYLEKSILSIHLIGSDATSIPVPEPILSKLNLQYQMAAERVMKQHDLALIRGEADPKYSRLIWMPESLEAHGKSYQDYLTYLQNDPGVAEGAEVLWGTGLEHLKTRIQMRLKYQEQRATNGQNKLIYLICDKQDLPAVTPLRDYLKKRKYEVLLPFKENSEVVSGHKENIRVCDAALFFYGSTDTIDNKLKQFLRLEFTREGRPLLAKGIYVSGPATEQKNRYASDEALVMKNFGTFSPKDLKPWLEQIEFPGEKTKGAPA
jgi:hypothetical protein